MKILIKPAVFSLAIFVVVAYAPDKINSDTLLNPDHMENYANEQIASKNVMGNNNMAEKMDQLNYKKFELEIDYLDMEYEFELNKRRDGTVDAELFDPINQKKEHGQAAFDSLYPNLKKLKIKQNMGKKDVIKAILETFDLPLNYKKAELDIIYKDGTEAEFKDRNY